MSRERDRVIPRLEALEERLLAAADRYDTYDYPRTGGVAVQVGSLLSLRLADDPAISTTFIVTDGLGDVALEWDGGPVHFFNGVNTIPITSQAAADAVVVVDLGPSPFFPNVNQTPQVNFLSFAPIHVGTFVFEHLAAGVSPGAITANVPVTTINF